MQKTIIEPGRFIIMPEIKKIKPDPCPYCGCKEFEGKAEVVRTSSVAFAIWEEGKIYYWLRCKKCKMTSPPKRRKLEALKAHNKRA